MASVPATADGARSRKALYVGGLDEAVKVQTLQAAFIPFGELVDVQLPLDVVTQQNKGFGFVEFAEESDAADALENMNNSELYGRVLKVTLARPQKLKSSAVWSDADEWYKQLKDSGGGDDELDAEETLPAGGSHSDAAR
jgi:peptidyl-prolyl isomerase E (cyclophilin E)